MSGLSTSATTKVAQITPPSKRISYSVNKSSGVSVTYVITGHPPTPR
jgi:hypothetical protein